RKLKSNAMTVVLGNQTAEDMSRRVTQRQSADVIAHSMIAIFCRRKRIDIKRHVKSRDGAVSKTVNGVNDGKCQAVGGEAVEKIAYAHDQNRYRNKQPRAAWIVSHADRQPRYQSQNRIQRNQRP